MPQVRDAGLDLLSTLDVEALQDKLLAALGTATGAQGAALWIADDAGALVLRGLRGLVAGEGLPSRLDPFDGDVAQVFRGDALHGQPLGPHLGRDGAALMPLAHDGEVVGLALLERPTRRALEPEQRAALEELVGPASLALRNARRFRALERATQRERDGGEYRLASFQDYAGKELSKARRYGRSFSVAVVTVDGADPSRPADARVVRFAARAVGRAVRDSDVLARASDAEHHVLLPETDAFGAMVFRRRVADEARHDPVLRPVRTRLALGTATFPADGDSLEALLHTCRRRQEAQRTSLVQRLPAPVRDAPTAFWELADLLLGADLPADPRWAHLALAPGLLEAVQAEAARQIGRDPRARSALYLTTASPGHASPVWALPRLEAAGRAGDVGARVFLLGPRRAAAGEPHPQVTHVPVEGEVRLESSAFLLFVSERAAYALLRGPTGQVFHTSDAVLVDALVEKLRARYDLPPV
jgi:GGDEF domain-containing protein